jgi:hypothetical protein
VISEQMTWLRANLQWAVMKLKCGLCDIKEGLSPLICPTTQSLNDPMVTDLQGALWMTGCQNAVKLRCREGKDKRC